MIPEFLTLFLESDDQLLELAHTYGGLVYLLLFLVIFSETGLVVAPFLPGDGLLFSAGVVAAAGAVDIRWLIPVLIAAAVLGNMVNYLVGRFLGRRLLAARRWRLIRKKDFERAHRYYEQRGGLALILGRFLPVVRTFAPFVAGIAHMDYRDFNRFNLIGAILWVTPLTLAGYLFGDLPWVQENFGLIYLGLVVVTAIPLLWGAARTLWRRFYRAPAR